MQQKGKNIYGGVNALQWYYIFWRMIVTISCLSLKVPAGTKQLNPNKRSSNFISTPSHSQLIAEMIQSHMGKDMCVIGPKVCDS